MAIIGGNLIVYLSTDTRQFERGMSKSKSMLDGLQGSAKIAAGVLMRDLARGLTQGAVTALKMGAQIETLRNSFDSLSAATGEYVPSLEELRQATQGMVSDTDLLLRANEALALGIPTEDLDDLFDAAIRLGKAMGIDATQGIQALTIGVGRQSRLVLDNLGIIVKAEEAYAEYARRIGKTSETLTENERRLGFQTIALEKITEKAAVLGDNISDTDKRMDQWTATIKNATTALGGLLQPLGALAPVFQTLGPTIGIMAATILPTLSAATLGYIGLAIAAVTAVTVLIGAYQKYRRETDEVIMAQDRLEDSHRRVAAASQELIDADEALTAALGAQEVAHDAVNKAIDLRAEASARLADAEAELALAEEVLISVQRDLAAYTSYLRGDTEDYIVAVEDLVFTSEDAQQAFMDLSLELSGLQSEYDATTGRVGELNDAMGLNTDAIAQHRHAIDKISDAIADRADLYAGEIKALQDEKEELDALVESGRKLSKWGEQRLKQIPLEIQALREKSRATDEEAQQIRDLQSQIRDLRLENTELRFSIDEASETIEEQGKAVDEAQVKLDDLVEKNQAVQDAQDDVTEETALVAEALEAEQEAIGVVEDALGNLADAHEIVVDAQETLQESNFALEGSLRAVEQATKDLTAAEIERERQRIAREAAAEAAAEAGLGPGEDFPPGAVDPFAGGLYPTRAGDTYQSATTQSSEVIINVSVGAAGSPEEARRYGREFADEAVIELRRRGAIQ